MRNTVQYSFHAIQNKAIIKVKIWHSAVAVDLEAILGKRVLFKNVNTSHYYGATNVETIGNSSVDILEDVKFTGIKYGHIDAVMGYVLINIKLYWINCDLW